MKERTLVSAFAMLGTLTAYYYAKTQAKDPTPLVMIGGFVGALCGEVVSQTIHADKQDSKTKKQINKLKEKE